MFGLAWCLEYSLDTSYPPQGGMTCPNHRVVVPQPRGLGHFDVEIDVVPRKCRNSRVLPSVHTPEIRARATIHLPENCGFKMEEGSFNPQLRCEIMESVVLLVNSEKFSKMSNETFKSGKKMLFPGEGLWRSITCVFNSRSFSALHGQKTKTGNLV